MSLKNKRIIWKAFDGSEFVVDTSNCETMEDVQNKIIELRKKHGYEKPTFMSAVVNDPTIDLSYLPHEDDIEDLELREKVKQSIVEGMSKPNLKKMN